MLERASLLGANVTISPMTFTRLYLRAADPAATTAM
jgi:hypothetical protein